MPVQTAVLRIVKDPTGTKLYLKTPDGIAEWTLGNILPQGDIYTQYVPVPEPTAAKAVSKKTQKRASVRQENEIMEALGGRRQAGSGAVAHLKGDGRVRDKYRVEIKYTRKGSYRVERSELNKIRGECAGTEIPLFVVDFVDPQTGGSADRWVMVEFDRFQQLDYKPPQCNSSPSQTLVAPKSRPPRSSAMRRSSGSTGSSS
jgi:hypothetical protein